MFQANPAMKSAVKSVRTGGRGIQHRGKTVYRDVRSKMKNSSSNLDVNGLHGEMSISICTYGSKY